MIQLLFKLLCGHALADFALQSDSMAKGKNRHKKPANIPAGQQYTPCWMYWLGAHALIHGGTTSLITSSFVCGLIMTVSHFVIDFAKCENWTNPHVDQLLHALIIVGLVLYLI